MILREAALLGVVGDGALSPWGLELTAGRYGGALSAAGALGCNETAVTLQADLTAVAAGPVSADLGAELGLLADVESRGAATVWRFSDRSIGRAFDAGRTVDDILGFLSAHAGKGVPQTLEYLVGDVARRHGTIRAGSVASYVRADDPTLVAELCGARDSAAAGCGASLPPWPWPPSTPRPSWPRSGTPVTSPWKRDASGATVVHAPARRRAASTERPPTPRRPASGRSRSGAASDTNATPPPDDVGFWMVTGPFGRPADPALDVPALVTALRTAGKGPSGPVRRDPRTGRIIGGTIPGSEVPGSRAPGLSYPAEVSPFDDGLDPFADLVDLGDDLDDDLGFDPGCDAGVRRRRCPRRPRRRCGAPGPAQCHARGLPDDTDERIALLDGARRDGRPLLIAYEHPRAGRRPTSSES